MAVPCPTRAANTAIGVFGSRLASMICVCDYGSVASWSAAAVAIRVGGQRPMWWCVTDAWRLLPHVRWSVPCILWSVTCTLWCVTSVLRSVLGHLPITSAFPSPRLTSCSGPRTAGHRRARRAAVTAQLRRRWRAACNHTRVCHRVTESRHGRRDA